MNDENIIGMEEIVCSRNKTPVFKGSNADNLVRPACSTKLCERRVARFSLEAQSSTQKAQSTGQFKGVNSFF